MIKSKMTFNNVKALLIDLTGVLYESGSSTPIEGSPNAIELIRQRKIPFRFLTNETQISREKIAAKLTRIGYNVNVNEIISPGPATREYLLKNNLRPFLIIHPEMQPEFDGLDTNEPNCVVIGDATTHFTYEAMNEAFRVLMKCKDNQLISMGSNKYYQENGQLTLDLGAYKAALEYACDKTAKVIGKPSNEYFKTALKSLNMSAEDAVMIGDDINGDVAGAQAVGIKGVLVRTGKFRKERDENHSSVKPDAIVDNLQAFINSFIK